MIATLFRPHTCQGLAPIQSLMAGGLYRVLVTLGLLAPVCVQAVEVKFETERLLLKATPAQNEVDADFTFTNTGTEDVDVISVLSGCNCLVAVGPDKPVAAGQKGTIHGVFKVGSFNGIVEKQMVAKMQSGGKSRDVVLTVGIEVPEIIRITPNTLNWTVGGEATEQQFDVQILWPEPIKLLNVSTSNDAFVVRAETVEEGKSYKVFAKPQNLESAMLGLVRFETDCRFEKFRNPMAFLSIRSKP